MAGYPVQPTSQRLNRTGSPLTKRLIRYWPFNDRGHVPRDLVTNGLATVSGAAWGQESLGRRLLFDGTDDYMSTAAVDLSSYNKITLSWWFYWDAFANDDDMMVELTTNATLFSANAFHCIPSSSSGWLDFLVHDANGDDFNIAHVARPSAATWHHVVWKMDKSVAASTRANAVLIDGQVVTIVDGPLSAMSGNFDNAALYFMSRAGTTLYGAGRLQNFAMFAGLLSDDEAKSLYRYPWQLLAGADDDTEAVAAEAPVAPTSLGRRIFTLRFEV